jgi:hypothetical protein
VVTYLGRYDAEWGRRHMSAASKEILARAKVVFGYEDDSPLGLMSLALRDYQEALERLSRAIIEEDRNSAAYYHKRNVIISTTASKALGANEAIREAKIADLCSEQIVELAESVEERKVARTEANVAYSVLKFMEGAIGFRVIGPLEIPGVEGDKS